MRTRLSTALLTATAALLTTLSGAALAPASTTDEPREEYRSTSSTPHTTAPS